MKLKTEVIGFFLGIVIFASFTEAMDAREPVVERVENATLQIMIEYSVTGEVALKVKGLNPSC